MTRGVWGVAGDSNAARCGERMRDSARGREERSQGGNDKSARGERERTVLALLGARARGRERVKRAAVGSTGGKRIEEGMEAGGITWARVGRGSASAKCLGIRRVIHGRAKGCATVRVRPAAAAAARQRILRRGHLSPPRSPAVHVAFTAFSESPARPPGQARATTLSCIIHGGVHGCTASVADERVDGTAVEGPTIGEACPFDVTSSSTGKGRRRPRGPRPRLRAVCGRGCAECVDDMRNTQHAQCK